MRLALRHVPSLSAVVVQETRDFSFLHQLSFFLIKNFCPAMVVGSGGGGRPREEVGPESLKEMEEEKEGEERGGLA